MFLSQCAATVSKTQQLQGDAGFGARGKLFQRGYLIFFVVVATMSQTLLRAGRFAARQAYSPCASCISAAPQMRTFSLREVLAPASAHSWKSVPPSQDAIPPDSTNPLRR